MKKDTALAELTREVFGLPILSRADLPLKREAIYRGKSSERDGPGEDRPD